MEINETSYVVSSLLTRAKALLQHGRNRWPSDNSWHWGRDTQLREDAHQYREGNGVQVLRLMRWHGQGDKRSASTRYF